jgi:hypothetical protein
VPAAKDRSGVIVMRRLLPFRLLFVLGLSIPASLATLAFATSAGATGTATCGKFEGVITGNGDLSSCTDTVGTGGAGVVPVPSFAAGNPPTITWKTGTTTTLSVTHCVVGRVGRPPYCQPKDETEPYHCSRNTYEVQFNGKVTASTTLGIVAGGPVKAEWCVDQSSGVVTLEPGTKFSV